MNIPKFTVKERIVDTCIGRSYIWIYLILTECDHVISSKIVKPYKAPHSYLWQKPSTLELEEMEETVMAEAYTQGVLDIRKALLERNWIDGKLLCNKCAAEKRRQALSLV